MKNIIVGFVLGVSVLFASVDINHASVKELTKLKGVGNSKAENIVAYIKDNGCFKTIEEIKAVKGIGKSIISKNKEEIKILPCEKKED